MARVVSWRISYGSDVYYAYITSPNPNDDEPVIKSNEPLSQSDANRIGVKVLSYENESVYESHFEAMRSKINSEIGHGEEIDLGGSAHRYWNVTNSDENEEVLMLVGADGKNTSEVLSSYYTFHLVNQAVAIGTGSDYRLDKNAVIQMEAFFMDRNGNKFPCDGGISVDGTSFSVGNLNHTSESTIFDLTIMNGTSFSNDTHSIECVIVGTKAGGGEGKAVFTATAVLGGKEGVSYDLIVAPKQFHFNSPQEVAESTGKVNVGVLMNGKQLDKAGMTAEGLTVGYEYDVNGQNGFYDNEDITTGDVDGNGRLQISPSSIYEHGGTIAFYLMSNGTVVDSDSASVVVDGEDGLGIVTVELDNEVEAIGVGDDYTLDLKNGSYVTASTSVRMYSGDTSLKITDIITNDATVNDEHWHADHIPYYGMDSMDRPYGIIRIILENGFKFGDDYRDKITLTIRGVDPSSASMTAETTCAFTIIAIKGGKDGLVYRLTPSCDYIMYDPNIGMVQCEDSEPFPTSEIGNRKISALATEGNYVKSPAAISTDQERITYSIGATYSSAPSAYNAQAAGIDGMSFTAPLSEVLGDLSNPTSRYITFYWTKLIGSEYYLIDRETVPVITAGLDGRFAKIELGNEVDAITVGDDSKLDIESETVEVGTSIRAVAPDLSDLDILSVNVEVIQDYDGWHSDTEGWPSVNFEVSDDGGETWGPVDGQPHKKWRFFYILPNGFDFGDDRKEKVKLDVRYKLEDDTEHTGSAIFTIVGVPGGKEGQRYALVPEVDIIRYFANDDLFDEETLICDAVLGLEKLDGGHIYYGERIRTEQGYRVLDIIDSNFKNYYEEGNSVQVRDMYFGTTGNRKFTGPTNQIAFYLTIDTDKGEMIVDHETVSIVSDGKDGDPNIKVELSNEIESISTGTDTSLGDMANNQYVTASTRVYILRGNEKIDIVEFITGNTENVEDNNLGYKWIDGVANGSVKSIKLWKLTGSETDIENGGGSRGGQIGPTNFGKYSELEVVLNNKFDFGKDMRKRLVLKLGYKDSLTDEVKYVRGLFTFIGIKGGKDGMSYRLVPTPDFVLYDFETQSFPGGASVAVKAYNGATLLSDLGIPYEIYYSKDTVYDIESIPSSVIQVNGGVVTDAFGTPAKGIEQRITFYLKVDGQWVDRETVPLITNGKEGKDGAGSFRFDLVNPLEVLNTGDNNILNISGSKTYSCIAYGYSGTTASPISVRVSGAESKCSISTGNTNDGGVKIDVTLSNGFAFNSTTMKKEIDIVATSERDESLVGNLKFVLVAVMNGSDGAPGAAAEGDAYRLRTNVSSIVYDGNDISPESISAAVYLDSTLQKCDILFYYWEGEDGAEQLGLQSIMNKGTYPSSPKITYSSSSSSIGSVPISGSTGIIKTKPKSNGTLYIAAFNGNDILDYEDIPVTLANLGGGSSGILADLTDDVGVVATGDDKKLEASTTLKTKLTVRNGFDPIQITGMKIENSAFPYTYNATNGGKIVFSKGSTPANEVEITAKITADTANYIDFTNNNPIQFNITITAVTADEEEVYASTGYSILGLKGGKDGWTVNLTLNSDQIFYDANMPAGSRFTPSQIKAKIFVNGEDYTSKPGISFDVKNSDMQDPASSELWIPMSVNPSGGYGTFNITETTTSEFQPLTIRAKSGNTVIDWETVQVYRNGKDGAGGLMADVTPASIFVQTTAGHPTVEKEYAALVSLWTGSTQDGIQSVSLSGVSLNSSYKAIGGSGTGISAKIDSVQGEGMSKYKRMYVKVTTSVNLSNPIAMLVAVQSSTEQSQTRYASFTLDPNQGGKGDKGPKTRMRDWTADTDYLNGEGGDEFWDYVYYDGSYYGCLEDHRSTSNEPPSASCYNYGEEPVSGKKWVKYSGATFTASRIAFFGDGSSGWTIDTKKIEHTTKSIALNGDTASIEIRDTSSVYEYTLGSQKLYTNVNLKSADLFAKYLGEYITVYSDQSLTTEVNGFKVGGSSSRPTLYKESSVNVPVYLSLYGTYALRASLSEAQNFDITASIDYEILTTRGVYNTYRVNGVDTTEYSTTILKKVLRNNSLVKAGSVTGTTSYSTISANSYTSYDEIDYNHPSSFWSSKFGYTPYTGTTFSLSKTGTNDIRLLSAAQHAVECRAVDIDVATDTLIPIDTGDTIEDRTWVDGGDFTHKFIKINSVSITTTSTNSAINPYCAGCTAAGYEAANGSQNPVETPPAVTTETYSYSREIKASDNENVPSTAVINGNVDNSSVYGDIVIATGIEGSKKTMYKWKNSLGEFLYTPTNPSVGTVFNAFIWEDKPYEVSVIKSTSNAITYNGVSYQYQNETIQDVDAVRFAKTRIYKDGSIVTSKLYASDGSFNGILNADSGSFSGGLNATNCTLSNAEITNSTFNGTVVAPGGNSITVKYSAGNPMFVAAASNVTQGSMLYAASSFSKYDGGSWLTVGGRTVNNANHWLLDSVSVPNGSTVKIPSFSFSVSGKKIKSCRIDLVFSGISGLSTKNVYNSSNSTGGNGSFYGGTYTATGSISIKLVYSYQIGGGNGRISMNGSFGGQIEVGTASYNPYYAFGNNAMYLTDGRNSVYMNPSEGISLRYSGYTAGYEILINSGGIVLNKITSRGKSQLNKWS